MPQQCSATSKQSGEQCKRLATPGKAVCVIHGSRAGRKPSTYRYAKAVEQWPELYEHFAAMAEESGQDLTLWGEIVLMRARLATALEAGTVDLKIVGDMWKDLAKAVQKEREIEQARENLIPLAKATEMVRAAIGTVVRFVPASSQEECWEELGRTLEKFGGVDNLALPAPGDPE